MSTLPAAVTSPIVAYVAEQKRAAAKAEGRRIFERLMEDADATCDEHDHALLQEVALLAEDFDAYTAAYPVRCTVDHSDGSTCLPVEVRRNAGDR